MDLKTTKDEIDLMVLLARFFAALKRNLVLTILLPLIGVAVAYFYYHSDNDYYGSSMLVETSLLNENECKFLFEQLEQVDTLPGLSTESRRKLVSLTYEVLKNPAVQFKERNPTPPSVYLKVTAKVTDMTILPVLDDVVVRFVNESPAVIRHRNERERFYTQMIEKIDSEIAAMDVVKKSVTSGAQATYANPSGLYASTIELYRERTEYAAYREEIKSIHLVKGFDSLTRNANFPLIIVLFLGFVGGTFVLFALMFLRFFFKYYRQIENKL